jgi:hypothetical protein
MGLDAEDVDGDGLPDLLVTNYQAEYDTYYRNLGPPGGGPARPGAIPPASFRDETSTIGLAVDTTPWIGWGCALADFDNDGWPDCFIANGHIDANREKLGPMLRYAEPPTLHRNVPAEAGGSGRRLRLSTRDAGAYFASKHVGRGAAFGDIDDDGDIDIVVNHMDAPPAILRNDTPGGRWLRLKLTGTRSNRDAVGARVEVEAGGRTIGRQRKGGFSMQSTNDPRLLIGLGAVETIGRVTVRWPSGAASTLEGPRLNVTHELIEPRGVDGEPAALGGSSGGGG